MEKEEINHWLENYIVETFHLSISKDISLLDPRNGILPRDLLQLLFDIEKHFGINFEECDIIKNRFDYLDNINESIFGHLQRNNEDFERE